MPSTKSCGALYCAICIKSCAALCLPAVHRPRVPGGSLQAGRPGCPSGFHAHPDLLEDRQVHAAAGGARHAPGGCLQLRPRLRACILGSLMRSGAWGGGAACACARWPAVAGGGLRAGGAPILSGLGGRQQNVWLGRLYAASHPSLHRRLVMEHACSIL